MKMQLRDDDKLYEEEQELVKVIEGIHREYARAVKPFVDQLVYLRSLRMDTSIIVSAAAWEAVAYDKNQSCISWGGFNLTGDEKSISEAQRLLDRSDRLDAIERMIASKQLVYPNMSPSQAGAPMVVPEGMVLVPHDVLRNLVFGLWMTDEHTAARQQSLDLLKASEMPLPASPSPTDAEGAA